MGYWEQELIRPNGLSIENEIPMLCPFYQPNGIKVHDFVVLKEAGSSKQCDEGYIEREDHLFKLLSLSLLCLIVFHEVKQKMKNKARVNKKKRKKI